MSCLSDKNTRRWKKHRLKVLGMKQLLQKKPLCFPETSCQFRSYTSQELWGSTCESLRQPYKLTAIEGSLQDFERVPILTQPTRLP